MLVACSLEMVIHSSISYSSSCVDINGNLQELCYFRIQNQLRLLIIKSRLYTFLVQLYHVVYVVSICLIVIFLQQKHFTFWRCNHDLQTCHVEINKYRCISVKFNSWMSWKGNIFFIFFLLGDLYFLSMLLFPCLQVGVFCTFRI